MIKFLMLIQNSQPFMMNVLLVWLSQSLKDITEQYLLMVKLVVAKLIQWWAFQMINNCVESYQTVLLIFSAALMMENKVKDFWLDVVISKFITKKFTIYWLMPKKILNHKSLKSKKIQTKEFSLRTFNKLLLSQFLRWKLWWIKEQTIEKQQAL